MQHIQKVMRRAKKLRPTLLYGLMAFVSLVGLLFGPLSPEALAITCQQSTYIASNYRLVVVDGKTYMEPQTNSFLTTNPPPTSSCSYINVNNIQGGWKHDVNDTVGRCWSFRIHFVDNDTYGSEGGYCAGPNDVFGIGGPVANGRNFHIMFVPSSTVTFTLRW
jgi:hypothetical protein